MNHFIIKMPVIYYIEDVSMHIITKGVELEELEFKGFAREVLFKSEDAKPVLV
jgi:hypothetical protein